MLPSLFVVIAMSVALTVALLEELPPMEMSPAQYYNYTQPRGNVIVFSSNEETSRYAANLTGTKRFLTNFRVIFDFFVCVKFSHCLCRFSDYF